MKINIRGCYKTSLGAILVIGTPINFVPTIGMKISNENHEFWEIKSISFNQNLIEPLVEKGDENLTYRGYGVVSISNLKSDERLNLCEYFTSHTWEMIE